MVTPFQLGLLVFAPFNTHVTFKHRPITPTSIRLDDKRPWLEAPDSPLGALGALMGALHSSVISLLDASSVAVSKVIEEMAPVYKLTYFPVQALGEPIRFLFAYGGIDFEDFRFDRTNWPDLKPKMPFGQVPVLERDGKVAHQSIALSRYAAKQVKLVGKDDWEDLEIDAIVDTVNDLRQKMGQYAYETDAAIKESRKEPLFKETIPYYLERLNNIVKANNGHLAVGRLTWADMYLVAMDNYFKWMCGGTDIFADYPHLVALRNEVLEIPAIKAWVEKRPKSDC